jgi:hypothetical protein
MTEEIKQENDQTPGAGQGVEFANRRKVLKGVASSLPVILTVTNGAPAAAQSIMHCIGQPENANPETCIPENTSDKWARSLESEECYPDGDVTQDPFMGHKLIYMDKDGTNVHTDPMWGGYYLTNSCHQSFA